ncbi:amino acid permease-associated region [Arthrobacter crystallopoietes BAB-32]|uniref:Amino acid permease-associated region n=1 Tax=Arthrobacter crystallopoietes BAB-32 TaxID=1246476 RepID=N1UTW3_9MICC|nr:APC family permease [Arthrobacter crystallopoietes]EMY32510.1 amino acid permease-associated region [Arthrobacter crystallopoietes BAB-32]
MSAEMTRPAGEAGIDEDAEHLASLGYSYDQQFKREMTFWGNVSLGFTYLSPVVGIYSLFAASLGIAGPPMFWSLIIVGAGQLLVATVFGEVVSNYPVAGGVYPWSRRLWGRKWGWMNGWVYLCALLATIASVAYGAGPFLSALLGMESSVDSVILAALAVILLATILNLGGTKVLNKVAMLGLLAELGGALVVGFWLMLAARQHDLSVLFQSFGAGEGSDYFIAFAAAGLIGIYQYYGFEACGDVAEEVPNPGRTIPKAMRMTIYIGGFAAMFVCLSLILAVPDFGAVISGADADPVGNVLLSAFGPVGFKVVLAVVLISFVSCVLSLQAASSRLAYSMARDGILPASKLLSKFSESRHVPPYALLLAGLVPALIVVGSKVSEDALVTIISFAAMGMYMGFQMVVLASLRARLKGWKPRGAFQLGAWGIPVNIAALAWGVIGMVNMAWPRTPEAGWFANYLVLISAVGVVLLGLAYMAWKKPYLIGDAPAGDAVPSAPARSFDI